MAKPKTTSKKRSHSPARSKRTPKSKSPPKARPITTLAKSKPHALELLADQLLAAENLGQARWSQDGPGPDMKPFARTSEFGAAIAPELVDYIELAEYYGFRAKVAAILSHKDSTWFFHPVRTPSRVLFAQNRSLLVTFLAGCFPIAHDSDSNALLVAAWETGIIASLLFDDGDGDFYVASKSPTKMLESYGDAELRPKHLGKDMQRLYVRSIWLARLFHREEGEGSDMYEGRAELDHIAEIASDAATLAEYRSERARLATHPHLAAHWLLVHAALGGTDYLADALEASRKSTNPAVIDLRAHLTKDARVVVKGIAKHFADATHDDIAASLATVAKHVYG